MKKLFVHLSLLCLLAVLLVPLVGCAREEENTGVEETTETTDVGTLEEPTPFDTGTTGLDTDLNTGLGTDLGTDLTTDTTTPPAQ